MKIECFINTKCGNTKVVSDNKDYIIGKNADNGQPYGICLPNSDTYISITKGIGKKLFTQIIAEIEKNKNIPVYTEHYFTPSKNDNNFCEHCNCYLTHPVHFRNSNVHPLFNEILKNINP